MDSALDRDIAAATLTLSRLKDEADTLRVELLVMERELADGRHVSSSAPTLAGQPHEFASDIRANMGLHSEALIRTPEENNAELSTANHALRQDIALREIADLSLRESENRFRQIAENIDEVFWISDLAPHRKVYVSPAYEKVWGRSCESAYAFPHSWADAVHPDDFDIAHSHANPEDSRSETVATYRIIHPEGDVRWILERTFPVFDSEGKLYRRVGIARDITEQHLANERLSFLGVAFSGLSDAIVITEADPLDEPGPRIVFVNAAFERSSGYTSAEVLGKSPRLLHGPRTQKSELRRVRDALGRRESIRAELINYTKTGQEFWIELHISPVSDATGKVTHFISAQRDISDRIALQEQLRQSQRLESVGQLTGGIAHDFNNLLTVILGNAELLSEQLVGQHPKLGALAEMVISAAQRGAELTQRLLAFARKQPLDPKVVEVNQLVTRMKTLLQRTLGEHIEIEFTASKDLSSALVDPVLLESALLNLCLNARDAMAAGGQLTLETSNQVFSEDYADHQAEVKAGRYVKLAVSDTGSGIAEEHIGRVFEPFFTTKDTGKGTGLGLAMVYGFIKQSGGHITLDSELGHGTTINLYMPQTESALSAPSEAITHLTIGGTETILLVEDDELVRRYAVNQLEVLGYRVIVANDGAQALDIVRSGKEIDLLFTDIVMPGGMSGQQLVDEARKLRPRLRVLYTSGYTDDAIMHHGRLDPGVQLLSKPYRRAELVNRIKDVLRVEMPAFPLEVPVPFKPDEHDH